MSAAAGPRPQHAPGDPVLVEAVVADPPGFPGCDHIHLSIREAEGGDTHVLVRAADVHPVPPTPDPRDQALAAVRGLHKPGAEWRVCGTCSAALWPCATIRALDRVVPVPAPPAPTPTPTGWTATREGRYMVVRQPDGEPWSSWPDSFWQNEGASSLELDVKHGAAAEALLTLRAREAVAAADHPPADDDRVEVVLHALRALVPEDVDEEGVVREILRALDAHRDGTTL